MNRTKDGLAILAMLALAGAASGAANNVVDQWQSTYNDVIRSVGGAPCPQARSAPLMSLAMFDAINSIDLAETGVGYTSYQVGIPAPAPGTSREAAGAAAAYATMSQAYAGNPAALGIIQSRYDSQLAAIPDGPAKAAGIAHGAAIGNSLYAIRSTDGFDADPSYTPGGQAGDWRVTPDGPFVQPFTPHWGNVTPWGLASGNQFRPTRLTDYGSMTNLLQSQEYTDNINGAPGIPGVKDLGSRTSATRTAEQTEIAWFWANDRDGTAKPPGQLVQISQVVDAQENLSLSRSAHMHALAAMAIGDACIAAWDAKYATPIDLWRPIDGIRETLDDGNPNTITDPTWTPLNDFTPPFPAYVSGHATMGAAHAAVMAALFGDSYTFTIGSDEFAVNPGLGYPADLTRTFNSFSDAAWENALSRIYLGVHFYFDALDGNILGHQVGDYIAANWLLPVPAPSAVGLAGVAGLMGLRRRRA